VNFRIEAYILMKERWARG